MNRIIAPDAKISLNHYALLAPLAIHVAKLRAEAAPVAAKLHQRTIWMLSASEKATGVSEMLPRVISLLRELEIDTRWAVMPTDNDFCKLTKKLHNLLHGHGPVDSTFTADERALYERLSADSAKHLATLIKPGDILVTHDPQPAGVASMLQKAGVSNLKTIWRCHIGLDKHLPQTKTAWHFLEPYLQSYEHAIFSIAEYIPGFLTGKVSVIHPGIDPLSPKNYELSLHDLVGILCNSMLATAEHPVLTPPFEAPALRLQPDGTYKPAIFPEDIGLLFRPIVLQVSRWDRLKGFLPLLQAFVHLKNFLDKKNAALTPRHRRRLELVRLVLAGPDPKAANEDPEAQEVLNELGQHYLALPAALQRDVMIITLPLGSRKNNALMVNALQRSATVIVQNSLSEGFGLPVTEAMWKRRAILATNACGLRQQIRDGLDGRLIADPEDTSTLAHTLNGMLAEPELRKNWGTNAQSRVYEHFLVFKQITKYLHTLALHS